MNQTVASASLEPHLAASPDVKADQKLISSVLANLGFCGHYLRVHRGGRFGKGHILYSLYKNGGTCTQRELGERFDLKPGSLSEVLAKLEHDGLITRSRDAQDSRCLVVQLTQSGKTLALEEQANRKRFRSRCLTCLSKAEQEQLLSYLDRIRVHWGSLDESD